MSFFTYLIHPFILSSLDETNQHTAWIPLENSSTPANQQPFIRRLSSKSSHPRSGIAIHTGSRKPSAMPSNVHGVWHCKEMQMKSPLALTRESSSSRCVLFHLSNPSIHPFQLGRDKPTYSMDPSGKLIYIRNQVVISGNVQALSDDTSPEGNQISLTVKEIGTTEIFAHALLHSPNGHFVTIVGDGEYIIYTALAWCNKSFGNGISFA